MIHRDGLNGRMAYDNREAGTKLLLLHIWNSMWKETCDDN